MEGTGRAKRRCLSSSLLRLSVFFISIRAARLRARSDGRSIQTVCVLQPVQDAQSALPGVRARACQGQGHAHSATARRD